MNQFNEGEIFTNAIYYTWLQYKHGTLQFKRVKQFRFHLKHNLKEDTDIQTQIKVVRHDWRKLLIW